MVCGVKATLCYDFTLEITASKSFLMVHNSTGCNNKSVSIEVYEKMILPDNVNKHFPDEIGVSSTSFKSSLIQHDVHLINDDPI